MAKSKVTDMGRIFVGNKCNNKCKFCNLLKTGYFDNKFSTEEIKDQVKQAEKDGMQKVIFRGGELTIHEEIEDILSFTNSLNLDIEFETNGRMFVYKEFAEKISKYTIKEFHIKIFSDKETGIKNSLKQTIAGIKNLIELRQKIVANIIITNNSILDIEKRINFIHKLGIEDIKIIFPENKKGFPELYSAFIPSVREAAYKIDSGIKLIRKLGIKLHKNELPYYYDKPHNLFTVPDRLEYEKTIHEGRKKISIIIPTANRSSYLKKTLEALYKQNYPKEDYEIIIVDDNSKDDTASIIKESNPTCNIKHIYWGREEDFVPGTPTNRAGPLRNIGADYSSGEYIVFIDTDIVVNPEFLNEHMKSHKEYDIVVGPSIREIEQVDVRENSFQLCNDKINNFPIPWTLAHEGNISISKETWSKCGVFSDDFVYWAVEGDDLAFRWFESGLKFGLNRKAWGIHLNHPPETVDKETFAKGIVYNGEVLYKRNLDLRIFNRYFISNEVQELNGSLNNCININPNKYPYVERITNCMELQKCKDFRLCQSRPDLIKRIISLKEEKEIFFRNDDAASPDKNLKRLIEIFNKNNAPLNLATIPKKANKEFVKWIQDLDKNNLIEIHQHGYEHINNGTPENPFEIGGNQEYKYQFERLKEGRKIMKELFRNSLANIYTPPFHGFNDETIKSLKELGFKTISASKNKIIDNTDINNLSVDIDPIDWKTTEKYEEKTWSQLLEQFVSVLEQEKVIGIGLHHELITEYGFTNIENILKLISMNPKIKISKMSNIIQK